MLKYLTLMSGAVLLSAVPISAQSQVERYSVASAGGWHNRATGGSLFGAGAGVEVRPNAVFGAAIEGGLLIAPGGGGGFALPLSFDGRLHLDDGQRIRRWSPFALAGYTFLLFPEGAHNAAHFGVGADYRMTARRAIRVEIRDIRRGGYVSHYWGARIGMTVGTGGD